MIPNKKLDSIDVSRRQVLMSSGSFIAGASALAWASTDRAAAATDIRDISIPKTSVKTPNGGIESAQATVVGDYQYSVNDADTTRLELLVAPPEGEYQAIDTVESAVSTTSGSGPMATKPDNTERWIFAHLLVLVVFYIVLAIVLALILTAF